MSPAQMSKMVFSFHEGWDELIRIHPSVVRLFTWLVLPLSLLPPAMIYYAGGSHGDVFVPGVTPAQWHAAAGIFFFAELITVPVIAWLIHLIVKANDVAADYHDCFVLAAIAPIPLWLSALTLFVPSLMFGVVIGAVALLCSFGLIYHGVSALFHIPDETRAMQMASVICGTGLLMWLLLMQIVMIP